MTITSVGMNDADNTKGTTITHHNSRSWFADSEIIGIERYNVHLKFYYSRPPTSSPTFDKNCESDLDEVFQYFDPNVAQKIKTGDESSGRPTKSTIRPHFAAQAQPTP
ncbi:predicted protein [Plenodomus lingam JN3]|uniref:Predicted protein n=1 Tax=Leptosphaeria maculans (strain JN3 / isolate v23.1.3 / race Av1-4-5-6-7-8) TaxID=985895 RepID=E5A228_LEPMJ|nr:predicted protein [Plenodomus lingam JN3]CBX97745.1 predicted protein [Plenodomus lingam JN3]